MTTLYTPAMLSTGLGRCSFLRACALASAVLLAGCGGGNDGDEVSSGGQEPTTSLGAATTTVGSTTVTSAPSTTTSPTTGSRSPVTTTIPATPADALVTSAMLVERTTTVDLGPVSINGTQYVNGMKMYSGTSPGKVEIDAGRRRKRFLGTLGIPDDQKSASSHLVEISLDGAAPIFSATVNFGESKAIDLDVTEVLRIRITVTSKTRESGTVGIGNPRFA